MVKLKRISVLPVAKIFCCLEAVIGFLLGIVATIGSLTGQGDDGIFSLGAWSLLLFPIANAIFGFLTGAFLAWGYNILSQWLGGIELELEAEEKPHLAT